MVRRECAWPKCKCKTDLTEIEPHLEGFCAALCHACKGWDGFERRPDYGGFKSKTFLCREHCPTELEYGELLGARLAKLNNNGQLVWGEVTDIAGCSKSPSAQP